MSGGGARAAGGGGAARGHAGARRAGGAARAAARVARHAAGRAARRARAHAATAPGAQGVSILYFTLLTTSKIHLTALLREFKTEKLAPWIANKT